MSNPVAHLGFDQISTMELFGEQTQRLKAVNYFSKKVNDIYVWQFSVKNPLLIGIPQNSCSVRFAKGFLGKTSEMGVFKNSRSLV